MAHPKLKISPSMERCDWLNMEREIRRLEEASVDFLHLDIMDKTYGHSILLSPRLVPMLKKVTNIPLDIHMFVTEPEYYLPMLLEACDERDYLTIQLEAVVRPTHTLALIREHGLRAGIVTELATPTAMLEPLLPYLDMINLIIRDPGIAVEELHPLILKKIRETRNLMDAWGLEAADLAVDGSIRFEDVKALTKAGANMLVLGSRIIFRPGFSYRENAEELRRLLQTD